jgi:hypothetical protein
MHHDLRFALRSIWRSRLFSLVALVAFSFGIAATATVFSVVDAVLLHPAAFSNPESMVAAQCAEKNRDWENLPPWLYDLLRSRFGLFPKSTARVSRSSLLRESLRQIKSSASLCRAATSRRPERARFTAVS